MREGTAISTEPSITIGAITGLIGAAIVLARTFGVNVSDDQERALTGFVAIAGPIVASFVIRSFVFSRGSVQQAVNEAHAAGKAGTPTPPSVKA